MKILNVDAPFWFAQCEIGIQIVFAIVTLLVAFYAYRVYRISRQENSFYFGAGFFAIGVAYFMQSFFNFLLLKNIHTCEVLSFVSGRPVDSDLTLSVLVVFLYMVFMLAGFSTLTYLTFKNKNLKLLFLITFISIIALIFASDMSLLFYVLLSVLIAFTTLHYYKRFIKKPTPDSFVVSLGFGLVFLGTVQLALSTSLNALYISGHIITLAGYLLLLIDLIRVVRK